jgi:hypothetical protein
MEHWSQIRIALMESTIRIRMKVSDAGSGPHLNETLVADPHQIDADPQTLSVRIL